jgi:outer membrane protein OmpA-like peptidoglycan-associated protein
VRIGAGLAVALVASAACTGRRPAQPFEARVPAAQSAADRPIDLTPAWDSLAPAPPASARPPFSLRAGGKELALRDLDARVVVLGPLAFTELHLGFDAPAGTPTSGEFDLALPEGAAVTRFAILQAHGWQEAEMVAVTHDEGSCLDRIARHQLRHPVVTTATPHRPSHFVAPIAAISAGAPETLIVSFAQPMPVPRESYRLSLAGLGRVERLDAVVHFPIGAGSKSFAVHKDAWTPDRDLIVEPPSPQPDALRSGRLVVGRVALPIEASAEDPLDGAIAVLIDTSASRARDLRLDADRLGGVLGEIGRTTPRATVDVAAFDQDVEPIYSGPAAGFGASEVDRIAARGALGATDLRVALRWAAQRRAGRLLLMSDGLSTMGPRSATDLALDLQALRAAGSRRMDAMTGLDDRGAAVLAEVVSKLGPGVALAPETSAATVVARLSHASLDRVEVPGSSWSWPEEVPAGTPTLVFAELPPDAPLLVRVDGRELPLELRRDASLLVAHEAARAYADRLVRDRSAAPDDAERQRLQAALAELSTTRRVLSPESRWMVLESESQYSAFEIDRSAKDLLGVGPGGVESLGRSALDLDAGTTPPVRPGPGEESGCPIDLGILAAVPKQVFFEKGRAGGRPADLSAAVREMQWYLARANPQIGPALEVEGFSDESASETENLRASRARAIAFRDVLVKAGMKAPILSVRGYGSIPPLTRAYDMNQWASGLEDHVQVRVVASNLPKAPTHPATPLFGDLATIVGATSAPEKQRALDLAAEWHARAPSDPMGLVALGMAEGSLGHRPRADRAFGALVDLSPPSAQANRMAAALLEVDAPATALEFLYAANDLEHGASAASHRALAMALTSAGRFDDAVTEVVLAVRAFESDRLDSGHAAVGAIDVLREDLGILAAVAARTHPRKKEEIEARIRPIGAKLATQPSLRFVLSWESEADVDLQVDASGRPWDPSASIDRDALPGEGLRLADVQALGPEAYVVTGPARAYPYRVHAHLQTPAGNVLGRLDVMDYDGLGHVALEEHPFVIQAEGGTADVATVRGPLIHEHP